MWWAGFAMSEWPNDGNFYVSVINGLRGDWLNCHLLYYMLWSCYILYIANISLYWAAKPPRNHALIYGSILRAMTILPIMLFISVFNVLRQSLNDNDYDNGPKSLILHDARMARQNARDPRCRIADQFYCHDNIANVTIGPEHRATHTRRAARKRRAYGMALLHRIACQSPGLVHDAPSLPACEPWSILQF